MSRGPQRFSQSADEDTLYEHLTSNQPFCVTCGCEVMTKLTAAATRLSDVVHDITFLKKKAEKRDYVNQFLCFFVLSE